MTAINVCLPIQTEEDNEICLAEVYELLLRDTDLSVEEVERLNLLTAHIEVFEEEHYAFPDHSLNKSASEHEA